MIFSVSLLIVVFSLTTFVVCILSPSIKIAGFATLDQNRLNEINKTISIMGKYDNAPFTVSVNPKKTLVVRLDDLNKYTIDAFVAVEDKRFFSHDGVDWIRVFGAMLNNLKARAYAEGASTITQQLVKNTHLSSEKTLLRKIQEIRIALDVEKKYDKSEILSMYLNQLYFGNGIYGIASASLFYFDKPAQKLTLPESAMLAGIINNPAKYNPVTQPKNAETRKNVVLLRMKDQGYITKNEYEKATNTTAEVSKRKRKAITHHLRSTLIELNEKFDVSKSKLFGSDYIVKTNCDLYLQERVSSIVEEYDLDNAIVRVIVLSNADDKVLCDYTNVDGDLYNLQRSPGSTIKPILCYAPALDMGLIHPITPINDETTDFSGYKPNNYRNKYYGWISVEDALSLSLNIPAVKILDYCGVERAKRYARLAGIPFSTNDNSLALALGNMSNGVTLLQLADAYKTFANDGKYTQSSFVNEVTDKNGNTIYKSKRTTRKVFGEDTSYLINQMLKKCANEGTAKRIKNSAKNVCAKTGTVGTEDGNTDAYCISYTPKYTVAVWFGAKSGYMKNEYSGGTTPTKIAGRIHELINDDDKFVMPNSVTSKMIDAVELKEKHRVLLAGNDVKLINKKSALFSKRYAPKVYSTMQNFAQFPTILDDFNNFKIIYGVVD